MRCGPIAAGGLALLALLATSSADSVVPARQKPALHGGAQLMAFGGRSAEQRSSRNAGKLDAALADLSRHLDRVRGEHPLEDLHALSPAARFVQRSTTVGPLVAVDAVTRGDPARLKEALVALGLQQPAVFANDVGGWLPVNRIAAAAALGELVSVHASMPRARGVMVTTQGDFAQRSDVLRANYAGLTGAGVKVGILSDSFNCYGVYDKPGSGVPASGQQGYAPFGFATDDAVFDETNGYLPATVTVLKEGECMNYTPSFFLPFADEGRAMMQIVHDVAPGAALAFYTGANSQADFASGITALAAAGATVIADDIGYYDEPFFQDGIIAQAIDAVNAKGVAYFSAAGNDGRLSYDDSAPDFTRFAGTGANAGEMLLTFGTGAAAQSYLPITIPSLYPGEFVALIVEWDQPYLTGTTPPSAGASSHIDLCVTGAPANSVVLNLDSNSTSTVTCTGANASGVDPEQVLILGNPASDSHNPPNNYTGSQQVHLIIGLQNGSPAPGLIKVVVAANGAAASIDSFYTPGSTLQGHPGAAGAAAVGASFFAQTPRCGTTAVAVLESYSSAGGDPILFDNSGNRLAAQHRQKPNFVGPDGVNTSFFGFPLAGSGFNDTSSVAQCQNDATYNNFFGTSAATPHVAAVAALMQQANPALTPTQIYDALQSTALPMPVGGNPTPDYLSGYGFIQADAAVAALPVAPLSVTSSSLPSGQVGTSYTAALAATGGTRPYNWSIVGGALPAGLSLDASTGAISGTPTAAVSGAALTVQVTDSEKSAQSKTAALSLTIAAAPAGGGGGGGGGLDALTLLALIGLGCARALGPPTRDASLRG